MRPELRQLNAEVMASMAPVYVALGRRLDGSIPPRFHVYPRGDGKFNICIHNAVPNESDKWRSLFRGVSQFRYQVNPMPGATHGFESLRDALLAIRCILFVERKCGVRVDRVLPVMLTRDRRGLRHFDSQRWWNLYWRASGLTTRRRAENHASAAKLGMRVRHVSQNENRWEVI